MNNTVSLAPLSGCFIAHSRTKGSKNGVRLYQYEDGTYTELGKARRRKGDGLSDYDRAVAAERRYVKSLNKMDRAERRAAREVSRSSTVGKDKAKKLFAQSIKGGKDKPNVSPIEKSLKETGEIVDEVTKAYQLIDSKKQSSKPRESKSLSDEELRKRISRLELERRYDSLSESDVDKGRYDTMDVLAFVGSTVGIFASAATIYSTLKNA